MLSVGAVDQWGYCADFPGSAERRQCQRSITNMFILRGRSTYIKKAYYFDPKISISSFSSDTRAWTDLHREFIEGKHYFIGAMTLPALFILDLQMRNPILTPSRRSPVRFTQQVSELVLA
jgi:hypothetical protein